MENRYLCRGKRIDDRKMIEGHLIQTEVDGYVRSWISAVNDPTRLQKIGKHYTDWRSYEVDPATICQCTGRTDRDEILIFEHDVIAYLDTYSTESGYAEADCVGEVVWDKETLSFQVTNRLSAESWEVLDGECKVLGNTIDNPELLEV